MNKATTDTEKAILEAAIKEFSIKGFDGARTAAIAAEAGVTHAMLHYYYRTKEKLFQRIFQEKLKDILNLMITEIVCTEGSLKDRVKKGIEKHFNFLLANQTLPVFLVTTHNSRPEIYEDLIRELLQTFKERISPIQHEFDVAAERGEINPIDVTKLFGDIAALNVFPFIATPLFMAVMGFTPEKRDEFLEGRKQETIEIILRRL